MADNHLREGSLAEEDEGLSHLELTTAEGSGDSLDQVDLAGITNGHILVPSPNEPNGTKAPEDGVKDDMFVDCPDEIENSESQQTSEEKDNIQDDHLNESDSGIKVQHLIAEVELLRDSYEKSVTEKESYEAERVAFMRELSDLRYQLKVLNEQQISPSENTDWNGASLHGMISECSRLVNNALDKRSQAEEKFKELYSVLRTKDQEIDFLSAKVAESNSSSKLQFVNDEHIDETVIRILGSLSITLHQEELLDGTLMEKISHIEKSVTFLVEKYNLFLSETDQLRRCLTEVGSNFNMMDEFGTFAIARDTFLELRKKEDSFHQSVSHLKDENRKLVEQLEKHGSIVENANMEIRRLSAEVEQERNRFSNTKEKLSMAVTKGKALVQQRDQLKQLLAEKTSQLEKCLIELQEKSSSLEVAEQIKEYFSEKEAILQKCEEILSEVMETEDQQPKDITEKLRWLVDENKSLIAISRQFDKLTNALLLFDFPETVASSELDTRVCWLAESFYLLKEEIAKTKEAANKELDHITTSLLAETQEKNIILEELKDLTQKYETHERLQHELAEMNEAANNEIDRLSKSLLAETQEKSCTLEELKELTEKYEASERLQHELTEMNEAADHLSKSLLAETQEKSNILEELKDLTKARERLQQDLAEVKEAAKNEIDRLTESLLQESQEKNYLQAELDGLRLNYKEIVEKESHLRLEKDKIVNLLLEISGLPDEGLEEVLVENCLAKIKEIASLVQDSQIDVEIFGSFQRLLYITNLEMSLYKLIVEEDKEDRTEVNRLSAELANLAQELNTVNEEKAVIQKSFEQLEDRCALLKDKLSMAIKKGKGLVQERENLKGALNEKNTEIDTLKFELQQNLSAYDECQDKITKLSLDMERFSQLETELISTKERADQLEQFLFESNSMVQRIIESIEDIDAPFHLIFNEPVEKIKWLTGCLHEHEKMEQELRNAKGEANSLAGKFSEAQSLIKSLEDALSMAENNISQLMKEKKELEISKDLLEEKLGKEKEEGSSLTSKFEEVSSSLSLAENNISRFMNEREIAEESRVLAEKQLQKLKDEFSNLIKKLADAEKTIQSLEDSLCQEQKKVSLLAEENSKLRIGSLNLENEIKKIGEETDSHSNKLSDASLTINSLEEKLLNAENNMACLLQEKRNAEKEILELNFKLTSCMEELSGTHGSIENHSLELSAQVNRLILLLNDETLSYSVDQCFRQKIESLNKMDVLIKEMRGFFLEMDSDVLQNSPIMEDDPSISTILPSIPDFSSNLEMFNFEVNAIDSESIVFHVEKMNEGFHLKDKILSYKIDNLSTFMDDSVAALLRKLHVAKDGMKSIVEYTKSLKQVVKDTEADKQRHEDSIASFENVTKILISAYTDATQSLELNVRRNISELRSIHELVKLDGRTCIDLVEVGGEAAAGPTGDRVEATEKLLLVNRQNQDLSELTREVINKLMSRTEDIQKKLQEVERTCGEVVEERDLYKENVLKLETDLEAQQNLSQEMRVKLDDYRETEDKLRKTEKELSTAVSKIHELEHSPLSASQVKSILSKMNTVEVPDSFAVEDPHDSADVNKFFYIIDSFSESLRMISLFSREKEELQSSIEKQINESQLLQKKVEGYINKEKDSKKLLTELLELKSGLQNIVRKLGGDDLIDDRKAAGAIFILPLLEKIVIDIIMESENLKSKNEELVIKLLGSQKVVDNLSNKVKLLEDSHKARVPVEIEERGISLPSLSSQSEISELQDMNNIPPIPSAAHTRTMRKGSSDHLAISIDSESEQLINNTESDKDKGHVFKSLNASGLIPRQGRTVADRVDGIWVSGSRALMSHPRGRLGLIAYWLVLHLWLLGSIL